MPLEIRSGLAIPDDLLEVRTSRSGGPGGQNVNKVETRVELRLNLEAWSGLQPRAKERLRVLAGSRLTRDGILRVVGAQHREQARNRTLCEERLRDMVLAALKPPPPPRIATKPPRAAREKRLQDKKHNTSRKRDRGTGADD